MKLCKHCSTLLTKRHQQKYCSNQCQIEYQYQGYITAWKTDCARGGTGTITRNISRHIKRYLIENNGERCSVCKWCKRHERTGRVPLEVDHIDGNAENNSETNLRLLCPNCHSLTPHFRNLNKGNGRKWRIKA